MNLTDLFKTQAEPIIEGGNIFPDAVPFEHEQIPAIMQAVNSVLAAAGARAIPIGSGATPTPGKISGDLDMIVDQDALSQKFNITDPKLIRKKLRAMFDDAGLQTGQSGVSVHVRAPVGASAHQVDIMVVPKGENAAKFHTHNIPAGSPYKGVNKHIALAVLAKKRGLLWSPYQGLFKRDEAGKKGAFATDDVDQIAEMLLGKGASGKDLGSVESILAALPKDVGGALLDELKADPAWPVVKESAVAPTQSSDPNATNYLIRVSGYEKPKRYFIMQYNPGPDGGNSLHLSIQIDRHPVMKRLRAEGYESNDIVVAWKGDWQAALADAEARQARGGWIDSEKWRLEKQVKGLRGLKSLMGSDEMTENKRVNEWGSAPLGKIVAVKDGRQLHLDFPEMPGDAKSHHFDQALRRFQGKLGLSELQRINIARALGAGQEATENGITFGVMRRKPQEMR